MNISKEQLEQFLEENKKRNLEIINRIIQERERKQAPALQEENIEVAEPEEKTHD